MNFDSITSPTECRLVLAFADATNYLSLSTSRSSRRLFDVMSECYERAGDIVEEDGGRIVKFMGDAIYAIFPGAEAKKAVETLERLKVEVETFFSEHGVESVLEIKAHIGAVTCGLVGTRHRKTLDAFGVEVNRCATLPRGGFVMSEELRAEIAS